MIEAVRSLPCGHPSECGPAEGVFAVLVYEDDPELSGYLEDLIVTRAGISVHVRLIRSRRGLLPLRRQVFDCVVLGPSVSSPRDLMARIKRRFPGVPVVMCRRDLLNVADLHLLPERIKSHVMNFRKKVLGNGVLDHLREATERIHG